MSYRKHIFKTRTVVPCYWCSIPLTLSQATADHIISRCILRYYPELGKHNIQITCEPCNLERGKITNIYNKLDHTPKMCDKIVRMLPLLLKWETLYMQKLSGDQLYWNLHEIDYILKHGKED